MGYETKVYIVDMYDRQKNADPRDITPEEHKDLFKEGTRLHSKLYPLGDDFCYDSSTQAKRNAFDKWCEFQSEHCIWGQIIAMLEMSCIGGVGQGNPTGYKGYIPFILPDGDNSVIEDCYGSPLAVHTIEDYLEEVMKISFFQETIKDNNYRRWPMLIATLETFIKNKDQWGDNIRVLTYGH